MRVLLLLLLAGSLVACDTATEEPDPTPPVSPPPPVDPPDTPTYSRVFVEAINILAIPFVREDGTSWDATTGPDLLVVWFTDADGSEVARTPISANVTPSLLPVSFDVQIELDTERDYRLVVSDQDQSEAEQILLSDPIRMSTLVGTNGEVPFSTSITGTDADVGLALRWIED